MIDEQIEKKLNKSFKIAIKKKSSSINNEAFSCQI